MQDITAELEKLIMGYPGQMASLARAAGIERSTLYKFAKGERVPSGEQLYRLTQALGMPPQRAAELMLHGDTLRGSSEPVLRSEVELLLSTLFDTPRRLEKLRALPTACLPTEPLPLCGFIHGSVNTEQMARRLAMEYLQGDDVRPVLVSPICAAPLLYGAQKSFAQWRGAPHAVRQILRLSKPGASVAGDAGNLRAVTRTAPFLFIDNINYEARSVLSPAVETLPGMMVDSYLLFPKAALICAGNDAMVITEPAVLEGLRQKYLNQYNEATPFLHATDWGCYFAEVAELYDDFFKRDERAILLRWHPPLALFLDEEMRREMQPNPEFDKNEVRRTVMLYLEKWKKRRLDVVFSEDGLLDFVRSGRLGGLPEEIYQPLSPALRRRLLLRLREEVQRDEPMLCMADPERQPMVPDLHLVILEGGGVVLCQTIANSLHHPCRREYLVEQPLLTRSMLQYLDWLRADGRLRSKKYTVDFIDSCLQML